MVATMLPEPCECGHGAIEHIIDAEAFSIRAYECTAVNPGGLACSCLNYAPVSARLADPVDEELPWRSA